MADTHPQTRPRTRAQAEPLQTYVITARTREGLLQQTRVTAASAVVLARAWREAGHAEVSVSDPRGDPLSPETFRANFLNGQRRFR